MENEKPALDIASMTKTQKLAALLVILGPDTAARLLKDLSEREIEAISAEMSKLNIISQELQVDILREFSDVAVQAGSSLLGGANYTRNVLEKSVGLFRATDIISRVAPSRVTVPAMQNITQMEVPQLFNVLKDEQPQTIALVASYLPTEKSSRLLMLLAPDIRDLVVERLASLGPTPVEVVERIADILTRKAGVKPDRPLSQTGGVKNAADLLNALEKKISQSMLNELEKRNPALTQAIRQKMFTFADLVLLDSSILQKVMREVDMRDLAISLKTASPELKTALLSCISKRAAETVNEEISFLGPLKRRDIEASQQHIVESVRQLEADGEIDLGAATSNSSDEMLV
jgi:flagellar motor switch protein FliG